MKMIQLETHQSNNLNAAFFEVQSVRSSKTTSRRRPTRDSITPANGVGVVFRLDRPDAKIVYVCGDFNDWSPRSLRMFQRGENGQWERSVPLEPGRYQYKFIVDGEWVHDANASENTPNGHGSLNSIIEVRAGQSHDGSIR